MNYGYYFKRFWPVYLAAVVLCLAATVWADRTVTTVAENAGIDRHHIIIIDAGHGGEDGGAISCTGIPESQINLQIALRLQDLCHLLGYDTRMIRTTDVSVYTEGATLAAKKASDLRQRAKIVNGLENGILISIHQNIFADSRYAGAQIFYAPSDNSKELAEQLQAAFAASVNIESNRKSKPANGVYLMQHIDRPGVLVECGFLSNPEEEAKLRSADYQKKLCCVIVSGLSRYINT